MEQVRLTGTGLQVSRICIGTMTVGGQVDEPAALAAVNYALDQGVNFFDTADVYTEGRSEEIMGKAIAGRRDRFVLASKGGLRMRPGPNNAGLSRRYILGAVEDSLTRLGTDYLDFYYLHAPDPATPADETLATMEALVWSGKVRYVGVSNFAAWQIAELWHKAPSPASRPVAAQMVYNLITRGIEQELTPFLKSYGLGLVVYNPLAGGLLTEKYADKSLVDNARFSTNAVYKERYWNADNLAAWDEVRRIAASAGIGMVELAYRWLVSTGAVDSVITGFSSLDQLKANLSAADAGPLPPDVLADCDKLWDGLAGSRYKYNR